MLQPVPPIVVWVYKRPGIKNWCIATVEPTAENMWLKPGEEITHFEATLWQPGVYAARQEPVCWAWWKEGMNSAAVGHNPPSIAQMEYAVAQLFIYRNYPRTLRCG